MADYSFCRRSTKMCKEQQLQTLRTASHNTISRSSTADPQTELLMNYKTTNPSGLCHRAEAGPRAVVAVQPPPTDTNSVMGGDPMGASSNGFAPTTFSSLVANNLMGGVEREQSEPPELDLTLRLDLPGISSVVSSNGTRANGVRMKRVEPEELDLDLRL